MYRGKQGIHNGRLYTRTAKGALVCMLDRNLTRPFMFMHHNNPTAANKTPNGLFFDRAEATAYLILVRGTRHLDFSDLTLHGRGSLMRLLGMLGSIDGRRCLRIQADYVLAFFDTYLKGKETDLLRGPAATVSRAGVPGSFSELTDLRAVCRTKAWRTFQASGYDRGGRRRLTP